MLKFFELPTFEFEFNDHKFYSFDKKLIPMLLGKKRNQIACNSGGSMWGKIISRRITKYQKENSYTNPKWREIFNFFKGHVDIEKYRKGDTEIEVYFHKNFVVNNAQKKLIHFKESNSYRKKILHELFYEPWDFRRNIHPDLSYILLIDPKLSCFRIKILESTFMQFLIPKC